MQVKISVVIPACNAQEYLARCLQAIRQSELQPLEIIVADDGSEDATAAIAAGFGATVLTMGRRSGPSFARNRAAESATGDILLFLDADVLVKSDTLSRIAASFEADPDLDAIMGSYDSTPASRDFISQYRNLMHAYTHQTGAELAYTFWSGCGAVRRTVFSEHRGFNENYGRPAVEDIELGYRLIEAGHKIVLDRRIEVTHLKRWTFWSLVKTDILDRGIPWTELILRDRNMPNDLNLQLSQRLSVALVFILVALSGLVAVLGGAYLLIPPFVVLFLMLGYWWGSEASNHQRPRSAYVILNCMVALIALLCYSQKMYGLIPLVVVSPALLVLRHRYSDEERVHTPRRWLGSLYICGLLLVSAHYLPAYHLILACFAVLVLLGLLNRQFYIFLAQYRGLSFALAAIPFHLLYHFYNGLSFITGAILYAWRTTAFQQATAAKEEAVPKHSIIGR